jgi:hypothetical protein
MYPEIGPRTSTSNVSESVTHVCLTMYLHFSRRRARIAIADAAEGVLRQKSLTSLRNSLAHKTILERQVKVPNMTSAVYFRTNSASHCHCTCRFLGPWC